MFPSFSSAESERRHGELTREVRERIALGAMDPVRAQVDTIACFHAAADSLPTLEDDHLEATLGQGTRSREPRHAGANDQHSLYPVGDAVAADEQRDRLPHS